MVALVRSKSSVYNGQECGGRVIDPLWVLTRKAPKSPAEVLASTCCAAAAVTTRWAAATRRHLIGGSGFDTLIGGLGEDQCEGEALTGCESPVF